MIVVFVFCHSLSFDFPHTVQIENRKDKSELLLFDKVVKSLTAIGKVWFYFNCAITFHFFVVVYFNNYLWLALVITKCYVYFLYTKILFIARIVRLLPSNVFGIKK